MARLMRNAVCAVVALALLAQVAWALKASTVTKLPGSAYVIRSAPDSDWLATWSEQADGDYVLYVINGEDGDRREVTTSESPGGICWIPHDGRLLLVKGTYNDKIEATHITYYTYDPETEDLDKVISQTDLLETYRLDPIAAADGSSVFHLTMGPNSIPNFNRFLPEANIMTPREAVSARGAIANVGSDYDLASDGSTLYWQLHDPDDGKMYIVGWNFEYNTYLERYGFGKPGDPADDHALIKVNPQWRAAMMVASKTDPELHICIYDYSDVNSLYIIPINLPAEEEVEYLDWKGHGNRLYVLTKNLNKNEYLIGEIDIFTKEREVLHRTSDPIEFVEYCPDSKTYYFNVVDERKPSRPETHVMRLH